MNKQKRAFELPIYKIERGDTVNLSVIKNDRQKADKSILYFKAYGKVMEGFGINPDQDIKTVVKKLVFYGVRAVNRMEKTDVKDAELTECRFLFANEVETLMSVLTPAEFQNLFPISKTYDGAKWQTKDFFYAKHYIDGLNPDEPIGDKILDLLWEYCNDDIHFFTARLTCLMSDMSKLQGYPGIMEEWAADNGISTYTMHTDTAGKKFMIDSQGKAARVKPVIPKYLRVVK